MTIALGLLAPDGAIIAADTQESFGIGGAKFPGHKIYSRRNRSGDRSFAATGSGSSEYLDSLHQDCGDLFVFSAQDIEKRLQDALRDFYSLYMLPFKARERPDLQALIAMSWKGARPPVLLSNRLNRFRRCKQYMAVGAGQEHADVLLSRILPSKRHTTAMALAAIAAFTIFHTKEYIEGCGKGTHITMLRAGDAMYLKDEVIERLERQFQQYLRLETQIVASLIAPVGESARKSIQKRLTTLWASAETIDESSFLQTDREAIFG